ncbi:MAG: hypothetical protein EB015_20435 [Methylocystaceae bacterium]|nr:hypothetical protein [Methylocystaceae bacterium]
MNQNQKTGALIIIVSVVLMVITLVLSRGWGFPGIPLYLLLYEDKESLLNSWLIDTSYVLAVLIAIAGYGVARYLSLIPPIFRKH